MKFFTIIFLFVLLLFASCLNTKIYEAKALIVSRSFDTSLQDSAMIYGYVRSAAYEEILPYNMIVLIQETKTTTECDSLGNFSLKLLSGTYTVMCFNPSVTDDTLKLENLKILPNEKVEIKFLMREEEW